MKLLKTTLTTTLLLSLCNATCMEKKPQSYKDATAKEAKPSQQAASKGNRSSPKRERSQKPPRSTSIPEVAKMINVVLAMQQQNAILLKEAQETREQVTKLSGLIVAQQALLQTQQTELSGHKEQLAQLIALTKTTYSSFLPISLLDESSQDGKTAAPSALTSSKLSCWQGNLDCALEEELLDSPNHPRLDGSKTAQNPWLSPNHPKK